MILEEAKELNKTLLRFVLKTLIFRTISSLTQNSKAKTSCSHFIVTTWQDHFFFRLMVKNIQIDVALLHFEFLLVSIVQEETLMLVARKDKIWGEISDNFVALKSC